MTPVDPMLSASASAAPADPARALIEEQMAMLSRLARIGMEIAEACGREAVNAPAEVGPVFARVARAVRMTIALQSRLAKDLAALKRADEAAQVARRDERRMRLRMLLGQAVSAGVAPDDDRDEDAIEDEIECVSDDAFERLTDAEDGDLFGQSFDEAVAAICKDLRLSPDWTARVRDAVTAPLNPTAPIAAAMGGGGPSAAEPVVEGPGPSHTDLPRPAPSTARSSACGPMIGSSPIEPPLLRSG